MVGWRGCPLSYGPHYGKLCSIVMQITRLQRNDCLNPLVKHLATIFCGFTERWIFRLADSTFVTKIFTIRQTVVITFITAALISITYQLLQVLFELHIRNSLWLILRELTGSLLNEVLLILLFPFPCFVSRSFTFSFFLDVFLFSCCFLEVILSPVSSL